MPKSIVITNTILLLCLSVLASSGAVAVLGGDVDFGRCGIPTLSIVALVCATVMFVTEIFTGIKWVPIVALASLIAGWVAVDDGVVPGFSQASWGVGWLSVAVWFAYLSARARENR